MRHAAISHCKASAGSGSGSGSGTRPAVVRHRSAGGFVYPARACPSRWRRWNPWHGTRATLSSVVGADRGFNPIRARVLCDSLSLLGHRARRRALMTLRRSGRPGVVAAQGDPAPPLACRLRAPGIAPAKSLLLARFAPSFHLAWLRRPGSALPELGASGGRGRVGSHWGMPAKIGLPRAVPPLARDGAGSWPAGAFVLANEPRGSDDDEVVCFSLRLTGSFGRHKFNKNREMYGCIPR